MLKRLLFLSVSILILCSCGEFEKLLKSTDYELKYAKAKEYFELKKYNRAATLLSELVPIYKGSDKAEESLYILALCYYNDKDYLSASYQFTTYYKTYPRGKYAEKSRYYSAMSHFQDSPEALLDQTGTYKAIEEFTIFREYFPSSELAADVQERIQILQDKLAYKEFLNARLYYNLGNYMGNNYQSAIIVSNNAIREYPSTVHREDFMWLTLRAKYQIAHHSVATKKVERYREVIDEYYSFTNEYPESKHLREAKSMLSVAEKVVNKNDKKTNN